MTNFEKYKDDLIKIEGDFAINKITREITRCDNCINCEDCIFNSTLCLNSDKIRWLCKEYEEPILSDDELELINILSKIKGKEYKYVARDTCGIVRFFEAKPRVNKLGNYYIIHGNTYIDIGRENEVLFSNIKHEDGLYDIENKCFIKEEGDD